MNQHHRDKTRGYLLLWEFDSILCTLTESLNTRDKLCRTRDCLAHLHIQPVTRYIRLTLKHGSLGFKTFMTILQKIQIMSSAGNSLQSYLNFIQTYIRGLVVYGAVDVFVPASVSLCGLEWKLKYHRKIHFTSCLADTTSDVINT